MCKKGQLQLFVRSANRVYRDLLAVEQQCNH